MDPCKLTASVMPDMNLEKMASKPAMKAKAMYVPMIPIAAIVGRFLKNAFLRTESPANKMMGGR